MATGSGAAGHTGAAARPGRGRIALPPARRGAAGTAAHLNSSVLIAICYTAFHVNRESDASGRDLTNTYNGV